MAIDPKLVSIKTASELPVGKPTNAGQFFFFEGNQMKKSPMTDIYDKVSAGIKGTATTTTVPSATGFERWLVHTEGTYTNFKGSGNVAIVVSAADLDVVNGVANNRVILEVTNNVATKIIEKVKGDKGDPADPAKLPLYSTIKSANIVAGTQFIDDENGNIQYRVLAEQTLLPAEKPTNVVGTKVEVLGGIKLSISENIYDGSKILSSPWVLFSSVWHSDYLPALENTQYVISGIDFSSLLHGQIGYFDATKTKISNGNPSLVVIATERIFTTPANTAYIVYTFHKRDGTPADTSLLQIEKGTVATFYKPHKYLTEYVLKKQFLLDSVKKVENISQLPETVISSKNLYNPYTRVQIGTRLGRNVYMSDFIEVEEGSQYYYTRPDSGNSYYYEVYDANKVKTRTVLYPYITIAEGEKYVKLYQNATGVSTEAQLDNFTSLASPIQLEKSKLPTAYEPRYQLADYVPKDLIAKKYRSTLKGKVCYYLGDSITNGGAWSSVVHSELGFSNTADRAGNLGKDGAQWTDTLNAGVSTNNNIKDRIDALEIAITALGVPPDVIIIALGTNDWGNNKPVGDYATAMAKNYADVSARTTVFDAVKYGITRLKKLYPNAFIVINSPIQRQGKYDTIYVDAIKYAAKMMSTPVIDVYAKSGVVPYDEWLTTYYSDGLHITPAGGVQVGRYVANELLNLYYKKST